MLSSERPLWADCIGAITAAAVTVAAAVLLQFLLARPVVDIATTVAGRFLPTVVGEQGRDTAVDGAVRNAADDGVVTTQDIVASLASAGILATDADRPATAETVQVAVRRVPDSESMVVTVTSATRCRAWQVDRHRSSPVTGPHACR